MLNGKGDRPRPMQISKEEWDKNFARIFSPAKGHCEYCYDGERQEVNLDDPESFGCNGDLAQLGER